MKHRKKLVVLGLAAFTLLPGCFQTRADIAREKEEKEVQSSLQQNLLQSQRQVDDLQAEIGRLQGRIEEMDHKREKDLAMLNSSFNSSMNSGKEGTEKQMAELRSRMEEQSKAQQALFEEIKRLKEENAQLTETLSKRPAAAPERSGGGQKKSAKADYEAGLAAYKEKNYDAALAGFRGYLAAQPTGKYSLSARYYVGDCLYHQKNHADAIVELGTVQERSPNSPWGRKSALRIAQSFKAMGKEKDAKAFAQLLIGSAPDSDEAKQARKLLK